ncbi:hypothetical protein [Nannocystis pusilla]|uniref:hypothetical protein n=1 Tax=Nannocystis pusilla TaxID=889268 RepID=UPI003B75DB1B
MRARIDEKGAIPPAVNGASVLAFIEQQELLLEKKRRKQREYEDAARQARDVVERFAENALLSLADLDPDKVRLRNDEGFSGSTSRDGHRIASYIRAGIGLSDDDWKRAVSIARIHHRQIGKAPDVLEEAEALAQCGRREVSACKDDVCQVRDSRGPIIVRTRCNYDRGAAAAFKRNIGRWRPHHEAWHTALRLVAQRGGVRRRFQPGLLLCTKNKAYTTSGLGEPVVYLQPELLDVVVRKEADPYAVAVYLHHAAAHELAHLDGRMGRGHDADFIAAREDLGQRTGAILPQLVEIAEKLIKTSTSGASHACCASCAHGGACAVEHMPAKPRKGSVVLRVVRNKTSSSPAIGGFRLLLRLSCSPTTTRRWRLP